MGSELAIPDDPPDRPVAPWRKNYIRNDYTGLTWESLAEFAAEYDEWYSRWEAADKQRRELPERAVAMLREAGFPTSYQQPYGRSGKTRRVELLGIFRDVVRRSSWPCSTRDVTDSAAKWLEDRDRESAKASQCAQRAERANAALAWLLERGKRPGEDFTVERVIEDATRIAHEELERQAEASGEPIDFDGQNCDGPCEGWVPGEHRCECGNRRVSFEHYGTFDKPVLGAVAY